MWDKMADPKIVDKQHKNNDLIKMIIRPYFAKVIVSSTPNYGYLHETENDARISFQLSAQENSRYDI